MDKQEIKNRISAIVGENFEVHVSFSMGLGNSASIVIHSKNPEYGIWENSKVALHLFCFLSEKSGIIIDKDLDSTLSWESIGHTTRNVKFRKISSKKGFDDLNGKLFKWLEKNKDVLNNLLENSQVVSQ